MSAKKVLVQSAVISSLPPDIHALPWAFDGTITTAHGIVPPSTLRPTSLTTQPPALLVEHEGMASTGTAVLRGISTPRTSWLNIPLSYQDADFSESKVTEVSGSVETIFLQTKVRARFPLDTRGWQVARGVAFRASQNEDGDYGAEIRIFSVPEPWGVNAVPLDKFTLAIWDPKSQRLLYQAYGQSKRSWLLGHWGHTLGYLIQDVSTMTGTTSSPTRTGTAPSCASSTSA